ncbi:MAG: SgcJ/EcaC family oxidoreductase [Bacteroidota bacterium]
MTNWKTLNLLQPEDIVKTFIEAWNERDAVKLASVFVSDAEFVNVTGLWWHNQDDIYKAHEYGLRVIFDQSTLKLMRTKTRYLSDTVALVHAKMKLSDQTTLKGDTTLADRRNILLFVATKKGANWWCEAVQNTEILPGKETFTVKQDGSVEAVNYGKFKS